MTLEAKCTAGGSIHYDAILQLEVYCKKEEKCSELSYAQTFFALLNCPYLYSKCKCESQENSALQALKA